MKKPGSQPQVEASRAATAEISSNLERIALHLPVLRILLDLLLGVKSIDEVGGVAAP